MYNVEFSVDELRELRKYFTSNVTEKQYKDITSNDTLSKAVTKIIYRQLS